MVHTLSPTSKDAATWKPWLQSFNYITLNCVGFSVSEKPPQGKLCCQGKANQPSNRVNALTVLCSCIYPTEKHSSRGFFFQLCHTQSFILHTFSKEGHKDPQNLISLTSQHQSLLQEKLIPTFSGCKADFNVAIHVENSSTGITGKNIRNLKLPFFILYLMYKQDTINEWPTFWPTHWFFLEAEKEHQSLLFTHHPI